MGRQVMLQVVQFPMVITLTFVQSLSSHEKIQNKNAHFCVLGSTLLESKSERKTKQKQSSDKGRKRGIRGVAEAGVERVLQRASGVGSIQQGALCSEKAEETQNVQFPPPLSTPLSVSRGYSPNDSRSSARGKWLPAPQKRTKCGGRISSNGDKRWKSLTAGV